MAKTKKTSLLPIILSALLIVLTFIAYQMFLTDKYPPLIFAGDINISFLTEGQAIRKVQSVFSQRSQQKISFDSFTIDLATSSAALDYQALAENFKQTHNSPFMFFVNTKISPQISLNIDKQLRAIASSIDSKPQNAKLFFDETPTAEGTQSARIQIKEAENGISLDKEKAIIEVRNFLLTGKYQSQLPLKIVSPKITTAYVMAAKAALETTLQQPIKLVFGSQTWTLDAKQLLTLLDLNKGGGLLLDPDQTTIYLKTIASEIDREVQEGLFEFNPGTRRVTAFKPSREGQKLDIDKTFNLISEALASQGDAWERKTISLPVEIVKPKIATSDVNNLGIKELLGRGTSNFTGSIPNRIYNVKLASSRINGVLIAPGEIFSFNQTVGDISAATGYKQAYVIKEGRTVLDDGGGVCQVSTTLFRAILNAGLPVVARTAHAYRVDYYERGFPPGLDATVFYPSVDLKFKNDTQNYILIQAYAEGDNAYVDLYGTADGRTVELTKPIITNQTPPPPQLRQDDPTLPKGIVKQVDWAAWGANVSFKRTVTRNGETLISETWRSNYKPWQAIYLVGTKEN